MLSKLAHVHSTQLVNLSGYSILLDQRLLRHDGSTARTDCARKLGTVRYYSGGSSRRQSAQGKRCTAGAAPFAAEDHVVSVPRLTAVRPQSKSVEAALLAPDVQRRNVRKEIVDPIAMRRSVLLSSCGASGAWRALAVTIGLVHVVESWDLDQPSDVGRKELVVDYPGCKLVPLVKRTTVDGDAPLDHLVLAAFQVGHDFLGDFSQVTAVNEIVSLEENRSQSTFSNRIVLQIKLVETVEAVCVCVHVQSVDAQVVSSKLDAFEHFPRLFHLALDEAEQMLLVHASRVMHVGVDLPDVVKVTILQTTERKGFAGAVGGNAQDGRVLVLIDLIYSILVKLVSHLGRSWHGKAVIQREILADVLAVLSTFLRLDPRCLSRSVARRVVLRVVLRTLATWLRVVAILSCLVGVRRNLLDVAVDGVQLTGHAGIIHGVKTHSRSSARVILCCLVGGDQRVVCASRRLRAVCLCLHASTRRVLRWLTSRP
ncbi:AMP deaminase [Hortaea werneckii]|nr:AMP deaminase [Hortaea werneckii]